MRSFAVIALSCLICGPVAADLAPAQLDAVRVDAAPNAALPLSLSFTDMTGTPITLGEALGGKPSVLIFADYTCTNLCGPILAFAAAGLKQSGLAPAVDYRLIVIGLDPKDNATQALAMKSAQIGDGALGDATILLIATETTIKAATKAGGYHYVYDAEHDQFAHPAAAFVITANGRIVRVLSGLGLSGNDLRLALVDAGQGRVGTLLDQIRLRCFGFDPVKGIYTASITRLLSYAGATTVVVLVGGIALLIFGSRRRAWP